MTIDKEKLKALAEAARDYSGSDLIEHESRYNALACEVDPVTVLTLLAEIERHEAWRTAFLAERDAQMRQRDQLRAENEGLRKALLEASDQTPTQLRIQVTSPKGTTERAVAVLQDADLVSVFDRATDAALARARELAAG